MKDTNKYLSEYNEILKENEDLYHSAAKKFELSDCAFWIIYCLRLSNDKMTQKEICAAIYEPKQTVNSALKKLAADGHIELIQGTDRRSKLIHLTPKGVALAKNTVDRIMAVEYDAMNGLCVTEQELLISIFRKITDILKKDIENI